MRSSSFYLLPSWIKHFWAESQKLSLQLTFCYLFLRIVGQAEQAELASWCMQCKHLPGIPDAIVFYSSTTLWYIISSVLLCWISLKNSPVLSAWMLCREIAGWIERSTLPLFLNFNHPIYFFHDVNLVDWLIFTVGRLTVGSKWNELPNQFQTGTTSELSPA